MRFQQWEYQKLPKAEGGRAIVAVKPNGHVEILKGFVQRDELTKAQKAASKEGKRGQGRAAALDATDPDAAEAPDNGTGDHDAAEAVQPGRPELTEPLANYLDLVRHSAVRSAVATAPKTALRIAVAQLIGGSTHWRIATEPRRSDNQAIHDAMADLALDKPFHAAQDGARDLMGEEQMGEATNLSHPSWDGDRVLAVYQHLTTLSDADVMKLLAVLIGETLALGTGLIDALGTDLKVDIRKDWQPDATLFDLMRDKETLGAMLAEVAGEDSAKTYLTATGTKKKEIIRMQLDGKWRKQKAGWLPKWLAFPQGQYTKRPLTARERATA